MKNYINIILLGVSFVVFSCVQENDVLKNTVEEQVYKLSKDDVYGQCSNSTKSSCPGNLTNDGCNFTSGSEIHAWQIVTDFETLLNNCRLEELPSNCPTWTSQYETVNFKVGLTGCCYDYSLKNFRVNQIKSIAQSNRPGSAYLIRDYQVVYATGCNVAGHPCLSVTVTYRKRGLCNFEPVKEKLRFN